VPRLRRPHGRQSSNEIEGDCVRREGICQENFSRSVSLPVGKPPLPGGEGAFAAPRSSPRRVR
jgi:hypothetical protein